jgi:uncharacterized protein YndB with AHSA1/START domain
VSKSIQVGKVYNATVPELWDLIATREGLETWLMPNDFQPIVGHRFTFTDTPRKPLYDGIVGCQVLHIDPLKSLRISWSGGPIETIVEFALRNVDANRTRLDVTQSGFSGLKAQAVRLFLDLGWRSLLRHKIPFQRSVFQV